MCKSLTITSLFLYHFNVSGPKFAMKVIRKHAVSVPGNGRLDWAGDAETSACTNSPTADRSRQEPTITPERSPSSRGFHPGCCHSRQQPAFQLITALRKTWPLQVNGWLWTAAAFHLFNAAWPVIQDQWWNHPQF